jgi:hypothetical protein
MGKTTDDFLTKMAVEVRKCDILIVNIKSGWVNAQKFRLEADDLLSETMKAASAQNAQEYKDKEAIYIATKAKYRQASSQALNQEAQLKTGLQTLTALVNNFDKYVQQKQKAWLGSKNSIPTAKLCINDVRDYIARCAPLAS